MQASGLTWFNPSICSSAIWGQPCFLAPLKERQMAASCFPQLLSNHHGGWQHPLDQLCEPSFTTGGQKSLMSVTFLVYWYGRRYFLFHKLTKKNPILNIPVCSPWDVTSLVLTCSWSPDLDVSFKVGVCSSEKRDTVFLNLPRCSRAN